MKLRRLTPPALFSLLFAAGLASAGEAEKDAPSRKTEAPKKIDMSVKTEAVSNEPQMTTASFGDWTTRCQRVGAGSGRICEVAQALQVEGQSAPIAQIAIGRVERDEPLRLTMALPVNVTIPDAPKLRLGSTLIDLSWRRCVPGACIADAALGDADLAALRAAAGAGEIEFKTAQGQALKLQASMRGLPQALESLKREPFAMNETKLK